MVPTKGISDLKGKIRYRVPTFGCYNSNESNLEKVYYYPLQQAIRQYAAKMPLSQHKDIRIRQRLRRPTSNIGKRQSEIQII
jgi:hypothetical protein